MQNKIILHLGRVGHPKQGVGHVEIHTLEGVMWGEVGDWIIRDELPIDETWPEWPCGCGIKGWKDKQMEVDSPKKGEQP
jgi:hypothetical protein